MADFITHTGQVIEIHDAVECAEQWCCVHNPSGHPLRDRPLHWHSGKRIMERICEHGIRHPDVDSLGYLRRVFGDDFGLGVHTCDGCCH